MRVAYVREKTLVFHLVYHIGTIREYLVLYPVELVSDYESLKFDTEFLGEFASFGEEFQADIGHFALIKLAIYY